MKHDEVVDLDLAKIGYLECRKCLLPECDDTHPRCPLEVLNGKKRVNETPLKGGNKSSIPTTCFGVQHQSIAAACRFHGLTMAAVYSKAKRKKISVSIMIEMDVNKRNGHDNARKAFSR